MTWNGNFLFDQLVSIREMRVALLSHIAEKRPFFLSEK